MTLVMELGPPNAYSLCIQLGIGDLDVTETIGKRRWAIAEGYIPAGSSGPAPEMTSHETFCVLNTSDQDANLQVTVYFADRDPCGPYELTVPARRTRHFRFNDLKEPELPRGVDMASTIESDVPVVVQHTRLDSRQAANALMTTVAFGA